MANIYDCTNASGEISGLTTETSGNIRVNYTLTGSSAGTAGGNSTDGTYNAIIAFNGGVTLAGYTGTLTVDEVNGIYEENKYYINSILQAVAPPLPDPNTVMLLNEISCIGYPDTIDTHYDPFKVHTVALTQEEIDASYGPGAGGQAIDLDGDGNPDVLVYQDDHVTVTEDVDSVNVDLDGDGIADIVVEK